MATKELDPGQRHTFALTPLRVQLTGSFGPGVVLRAVDQAGAESTQGMMRLTAAEMVLTPQPRRVRLVASPPGGSFPAGTTVGLMVRTEGANVVADQVMVAPFDVGALDSREVAVIEFAEGRSVLSVIAAPGAGARPAAPNQRETLASTAAVASAPQGAAAPLATVFRAQGLGGEDDQLPWLKPGRYALRDAAKVAGSGPGPDAPAAAWGMVLDGSASMRGVHRAGGLRELVRLVAGIAVEWTRTWPGAAVVASVETANQPAGLRDPDALLRGAYEYREPSSWSSVAQGVQRAIGLVGQEGFVVVVTDGVPGDVERLAAVASAHPAVRIGVVAVGQSAFGLASDGACNWWAEELAGFGELGALTNVRLVAVRRGADGPLDLSGRRPAEIALALTGPRRAVVPA